jgi:Domain of unknown function (DUF4412)
MSHVVYVVLFGIGLLAFPGLARAGEFEGVIHMTMKHADSQPGKMDWMIKGDKARIERSREDGRSQSMIVDATTKTMLMLFPDRKTYTEVNFSGERGDKLGKFTENNEVERTGKQDTIAGYSCEIWRIREKDDHHLKSEVCVGKGFGQTASFWVEPSKAQPSWVTELINTGGFGLRSIHYDRGGKESSCMEVTSIEKRVMEGSLFTAPADYKKMDAGLLPGGGAGSEELRQKLEEMKKRRAATGGDATGSQKPDMSEAMKQFGEMLKKKQQQGGQ